MTEERLQWIDLDVPFAPKAVNANQQKHLVYELFLHNSSAYPLVIHKVEVLPASQRLPVEAAQPLCVYEGKELQGNTLYLEENLRHALHQEFSSQKLACVFIWITLEGRQSPPARLYHRVHFTMQLPGLGSANEVIGGGLVTLEDSPLLVLAPPLKGENWLALNGPSNLSEHRRALLPYAQNPYFPQRYAIDWLKIGRDGKLFNAEPALNQNWHCYGSEVLAVADGTVCAVVDGLPENVPLSKRTALPVRLDNAAGNYVVLDLGERQYAVYAHLQPGSMKVSKGDAVKKGQTLALVGNSGNSQMPHLHFHIGSTKSPVTANGLPYVLEAFVRGGAGKIPSPRKLEMPLENMLVNF